MTDLPTAPPAPAAGSPRQGYSRAAPLLRRCRIQSLSLCDLDDLEVLGQLRGVRVAGTRVHLELLALRATEAVLGQHALDGLLDQPVGVLVDHLTDRPLAEAARVATVVVDELALALVARHRDLLGIDDDHEVTGVDVRRELRLVLATQQGGGVGGQPAEDDVGGVDDMPSAGDLAGLRTERTHGPTSSSLAGTTSRSS